MHLSSYYKMKAFLETYDAQFPRTGATTTILEVGSKSYEGQRSYRELLDPARHEYVGLDLEDGQNVSLVPARGYIWDEIASGSIDVCISGQTFEHNPFFWVTMAEISRCLRPGGLTCIIAPGSQAVHRFPYDCWRFYPDSWAALCALTGLELVESYFEDDEMAMSVIDGNVRDSMVIARKPEGEDASIVERLRLLTEPFRTATIHVDPVASNGGKAIDRYKQIVPRARKLRARAAFAMCSEGPVAVYNPD